jgi:hypothetical protein
VGEGLDPERVFDTFVDYWRSVPGAKGRKVDWAATWRNWCRREGERIGGSRTAIKPRLRTAEEVEAEERAREQHAGR